MSQLPPVPPAAPGPQRPILEYEPATPPAKRTSFGIYWWGWLCCGISAVTVAALTPYTAQTSVERESPYIIGTLLGILLIGIIPALIAFYVGQRSRKAATITFVIFIALGVMGQVVQVIEVRQARAANSAWSQVNAQVGKTNADITKQIQSGEGVDARTAKAALDSLADTATKASANLRGEEGATMRATAAFFARLQQLMEPYTATYKDVMSKTPLDPSWIRKKEDIVAARQSIATFRQTNATIRASMSNLDKMAKEEFAKEKLSSATQARVIGGLSAKFGKAKPYLATVRDCDDELAAELLKLCRLLETNWGRWHFDAERELTVFDDDQALQEFNAIVARVQAIGARQVEAQKKYVQLMQ